MGKNRNLLSKGKPMITYALLLSAFFSCQKNDTLNQEEITSEKIAASATGGNILYHEDFEDNTPFANLNTQFETSHAFSLTTNPVFQGNKGGRFELRDNDPENNGGTRAEAVFPVAANLNRWYSFAVYFPSSDFKYDAEDELIGQWKQHEHNTSSAISLRIKEDRFRLSVIPSYMSKSEKIDLGQIPKDQWLTFVIHVKHSTGTDGLIELWLNGKKIVDRAGSNMYKLTSEKGMTNPEWKIGIYKSSWNGSQSSSTTKRVLFYDDIKLGNENASLAEMTPVPKGGTAPTPTPTPTPTPVPTPTPTPTPGTSSPITGVTLVSAHTEKDITSITNGGSIKLSTIDVDKFNLRANTTGSVGSVKFELSGAQKVNFIDSQFPFSLHGDDGKGNYYYGTWNPPALGQYTLKATPYSGAKGTGTAGQPYTISFSFVK